MNSRSSVNESNLVNLSGDLTALNQLDTKDSLALSFPFDHIYACHSEGSDLRPTHLDKEVEISSHSDDKNIVTTTEPSFEVNRLSKRLSDAETQNKKLKNLLVYHLDLIQQQNELITTTDKLNTSLRLENGVLKSKLNRLDRRTVNFKHNVNPHLVPGPTANVTSTIKTEASSVENPQTMSLTEFLMPESRTNTFLYTDITKTEPFASDSFDLNQTSETDVTSYLPGDLGVSSILDSGNLHCDNFGTMIENKRSYVKKEVKTEPRPEPLYTVTSNSGNTVIQKIQRSRRRTSGGLGSLSRLPKTPVIKTETTENVNVFEDDKTFERTFSVNKKSKMINTYGKSKTSTLPKKTPIYTGSLSDRLQLIDTTPTGEDPYQLGEADMREQSPIPKLMLQKTNHGRMKICSDLMGESTIPSRRIYDAPATETSTKMPNKIRLEKRYHLPNIIPYTVPQAATHTSTHTSTNVFTHTSAPTSTRTSTYTVKAPLMASYKAPHMGSYKAPHMGSYKVPHMGSYKVPHMGSYKAPHKSLHLTPYKVPHKISHSLTETKKVSAASLPPPSRPLAVQQQGLDLVKRAPSINWRIYSPSRTPGTEKSLCDFSYGENMNNLASVPSLDVSEFQQLLEADEIEAEVKALQNMEDLGFTTVDKNVSDKTKRRGVRTSSLISPGIIEDPSCDIRRGMESKRGRKRAMSTAGLGKNAKQNLPKPVGPRPKMVRGRGTCRGKKSPLPGMMTRKPYHTLVGDPDLSWYLGLDPDVKTEDIDQSGDSKASTVEVPRWREKPYTSVYTLEGTENLDDKIFEKRHQKLEAEERRQLRWHMRRIREQRHVERLRMRQRDPWYSRHSPYQPSVYTLWPQPQRDVRMIEITDTIPVMAFGEDLPDLPRADFMLPWVRTSKALKRSKRSKTLH